MRFKIAVLMLLVGCLIGSPVFAQYIPTAGMSSHSHGAGLTLWDLDDNGRPEMILLVYHNQKGMNLFRYKIGRDLAPTGEAAKWDESYIEVEGVGEAADGAGAAVGDINMNGRPDLVLLAYDAPKHANRFRYKIGWDLNAAGVASSWSAVVEVEGVGHVAEGADVALADLDDNGVLDLMLMAYDSPKGENSFRYKIGWNLNPGAIAANWTTGPIVPGAGSKADGAGLAVGDLNGNQVPDLVFLAYDRTDQGNRFAYIIGWDVDATGVPAEWSEKTASGMGGEAGGAGLALWDMLGNGTPELIMMAYDLTSKGDTRVSSKTSSPTKAGQTAQKVEASGAAQAVQTTGPSFRYRVTAP